MTKEFPQRIHIIGSVGSGKTTLARELSKTFQIPYYELDNVAWIRKEPGDILRTDEEKRSTYKAFSKRTVGLSKGYIRRSGLLIASNKLIAFSFSIRLTKFGSFVL